MTEKLIYFDNAATTFPKPSVVPNAVSECIRKYGGNPGRGAHRLSTLASDLLYGCRESAASFFGCQPEKVVFTYSATYALNLAIKGLLRPGDHVLVSGLSHNAVYRPVAAMANRGEITYDVYPHRPGDTDEDLLLSINRLLRPNTAAVIATHASNITSETEPIGAIGAFCRKKGLKLIVDGAQSAGHLPLDVEGMDITALCVPGHKGLYGIQGIGMLLCGNGNAEFTTIIEGGSGIHSKDAAMPDDLPERLEAGTSGTPAIAGLLAGLDWVKRVGIREIHEHCAALSSYLWCALASDPFFTVYGSGDGGVVSFNAGTLPPSETAKALSDQGFCLRSGFHCAPLAHQSVGSFETGSVRASFSYYNSIREIDLLLDCLAKLKR